MKPETPYTPQSSGMAYKKYIQTETLFESGGAGEVPHDLISVCVSSHNSADYVTEALDSVVAQTHPNIELIVLDDHSPDAGKSVKVITEWLNMNGGKFYHSLLIRHLYNQGLPEARNSAIEVSRGRYYFVLDHDNAMYPRALSCLYRVMESGEWGAAYSQLEFFGKVRKIGVADVFSKEAFLKLKGNYIDAMALVSKKVWSDLGGYIELGGYEDYDFWLRMLDRGIEAAFVPQILCRYRFHEANMSIEMVQNHINLAAELARRHPWIDVEF